MIQQLIELNSEREGLKHFLTFATNDFFFIFDGKYYTQTDGVAMGSPLGPTLVDTILCHFEIWNGFQNAL